MAMDASNLVGFHYQKMHFINRGCFSSIYLGQNVLTLEKVAIKIQDDHPEMLFHEASLLNYLRRNGCTERVPQMLWFGQHAGQSCMVMNYYNVCLQEILFAKPFTLTQPSELNELMVQMLMCLEAVHKAGVIHRDIKPKNFMMHLKDDSPDETKLHLIDFGMATSVLPTLDEDDSSTEDGGADEEEGLKDGFTGNLKYMSWFVENEKCPASFRDDLISVGYIYLLTIVYLKWLPVDEEQRKWFQNTSWKKRSHWEQLLNTEKWKHLYSFLDYCYDLEDTDCPKYYLLLKLWEN